MLGVRKVLVELAIGAVVTGGTALAEVRPSTLTPLWQSTRSDSHQTLAVPETDTLSLIGMGVGLCLLSFCRRKAR